MLIVNDDKDEFVDAPESIPREDQGLENSSNLTTMELSLQSIVGIHTQPSTFKMRDSLKGVEVIIMVHNGASHNFIFVDVVKLLKLPIDSTSRFSVQVGNGVFVDGKGLCSNITFSIQGLEMCEFFHFLDLGSSDIILGVTWLQKLRDVSTNYSHLTMSFTLNDPQVS